VTSWACPRDACLALRIAPKARSEVFEEESCLTSAGGHSQPDTTAIRSRHCDRRSNRTHIRSGDARACDLRRSATSDFRLEEAIGISVRDLLVNSLIPTPAKCLSIGRVRSNTETR